MQISRAFLSSFSLHRPKTPPCPSGRQICCCSSKTSTVMWWFCLSVPLLEVLTSNSRHPLPTATTESPRGSLSPFETQRSLSAFWNGLLTQHLIKEKSMVHTAAISLKLSPGPNYYLRPFLFEYSASVSIHLCTLNSKTCTLYSQRTQLYVGLGPPQIPGALLTTCLNVRFPYSKEGKQIWILRVHTFIWTLMLKL